MSLPGLVLALVAVSRQQSPLSVSEAVRIAFQQSPKLRAAIAGSQAAQAQTDRERPVARPIITTKAEGRIQGPRVTLPGPGDGTIIPEEYGRVAINADQVLFRPGIGAARTRYAAESRANGWEVRRAENDLILEVRRAWFQTLGAQGAAEVAREGVNLSRRHLQLTRDMETAGTASQRDVMASDADLAEAEQGSAKADTGLAESVANLNRILGRDLATPIALGTAPAASIVPDSPAPGFETAMIRRPEIRQLEEAIVAAKAGAELAAMQNSPTLSGRATAAAQTPTVLNSDRYYAAGLVVTWNPFDRARTRADVQEARARTAQLQAQLEDAKLGIRLEVDKAWRDMKEARSRVDTSERQVASAEKALEISELRYQARSGTQLEVSGALFNAMKAKSNRTQADIDLQIAAAEYAHATGADVRQP